jgi:hypothetical protein
MIALICTKPGHWKLYAMGGLQIIPLRFGGKGGGEGEHVTHSGENFHRPQFYIRNRRAFVRILTDQLFGSLSIHPHPWNMENNGQRLIQNYTRWAKFLKRTAKCA